MTAKVFSHYKLIEKLGQGGMGEVYMAEDAKLHRQVALKFLPKHLTTDGEARERFEREARAAAALNHINIVTIHEINEHDGQVYIAMEYVRGETLRKRLSSETAAMDTGEAVDIASQICSGLRAAHDAGIVHRDLKPENIIIDTNGQVKILDFGLAKLRGVTKLTKESSTLGTIHYMSPEQARGEDVDARTDVWSLGVMLYEMLTGRRPFKGDFEQAVVYSILNEEPTPVGKLRSGAPSALEAAVSKALKKNRDERFQDVSALKDAIGKLHRETKSGSRSTKPALRNVVRGVVAILIGLSAVILAVSYYRAKTEKRVYIPPDYRQVTFTGDCGSIALSPDGDYLAYTSKRGDSNGIFVKDLRGGSAVCIHTAPRCWVWDWNLDGSSLLFSSFTNDSTMGTFIVPRLGGTPRRVHARPWPFFAWSPDGQRIAHIVPGGKTLDLIDLNIGETRTFDLGPDVGEVWALDWSRVRDELLFQADDTERQVLWAVKPDGSQKRLLMENSREVKAPIEGPVWSPSGDAVYYLGFGLRGQAVYDLKKTSIDEKTGVAKGDPRVLLRSLQMYDSQIDVTDDGKRLSYLRATEHSNMWLVTIEDREKDRTLVKTQLTASTTWKSRADISPDGSTIVFAMSEGDASNIYTLPLEFEEGAADPPSPQQLTFFESINGLPAWSPDGKEIVFVSAQGDQPCVWRMGSNGESPRPIEGTDVESMFVDDVTWAPGQEIIYRASGLRNFVVLNPRNGEQHPLVEDESVGYIFAPRWSPDGKRVVMFWNRENQANPSMDLWVLSLEDSTRERIAGGVFNPVVWSSDGEWIYAVDYGANRLSNAIYRIPAGGGEPEQYVELPFDDATAERISITPDGRKIVYAEVITQSDAWIVDYFDPETK